MDKRGPARIEALCATKAAGDDNREVDAKNGCRCEAKGQQTRPARRPSPVICSRPRQIRMRSITDAAACCPRCGSLLRATEPSDRRQGLISDTAHHRFKVISDIPWKLKPFDDGNGSKQGKHANIIERQGAVDRQWALDQSIEPCEAGHEVAYVASRVCPKLNEVAERFALAQIVVVERGDGGELR